MITLANMRAWFQALAKVYTAEKDYLTELDAAIGDADHGINMERGFTALEEAILKNDPKDIPALLKLASMVLIKTVGGASGPLYGTFFMKMAAKLPALDSVTAGQFVEAVAAGVEGIEKIGRSTAGEKTMLDVWIPVLEAMKKGIDAAVSDKELFTAAVTTAEAGMKATVPMLATKGRASYLGERSIGHQDPGATSSYMMLKAAGESL